MLVENKNVKYIRESIKDRNIIEKYDLGISFLYHHKIPKSELSVPWINFHPGPLPDYRGRNVVYQAMTRQGYGDGYSSPRFGATIHYIDEDFDTGDIIEVDKFFIEDSDTAGDVLEKTYKSLVHLFYKYLPRILDGEKLPRQKQSGGTYFKKEPIDNFVNLGPDLNLKVRALTVHPRYHAKIKIGNKIYKIVPEESCT